MGKYSETGHVINVAHFSDLVEHLVSLPFEYNPGRAQLKLEGLKNTLLEASMAMDEVTQLRTELLSRIKDRQILYAALPGFATRVINAMAYCDASKETLKNARAVNRKLRGKRAKPIAASLPTEQVMLTDGVAKEDLAQQETNYISVCQLSFEQKEHNFRQIVAIAKLLDTYTPNEAEMCMAGLEAHCQKLLDMNLEIAGLAGRLFAARYQRDLILYSREKGIYFISQRVRQYLRSVLGPKDERYEAIRRIRFTLPR